MNQVPVSIDGRADVVTIPGSVVRVRVPPGELRLRLDWDGQPALQTVSGAAGEVRFVQLVGSAWTWGSEYWWAAGNDADARDRATRSTLIADLDLRP